MTEAKQQSKRANRSPRCQVPIRLQFRCLLWRHNYIVAMPSPWSRSKNQGLDYFCCNMCKYNYPVYCMCFLTNLLTVEHHVCSCSLRKVIKLKTSRTLHQCCITLVLLFCNKRICPQGNTLFKLISSPRVCVNNLFLLTACELEQGVKCS